MLLCTYIIIYRYVFQKEPFTGLYEIAAWAVDNIKIYTVMEWSLEICVPAARNFVEVTRARRR